jgi:uncharacterized protein (TIGR02996 family)
MMDIEKLAALWSATRDPLVQRLVEAVHQPADAPEDLTGRGKKAHASWMALAAEAPGQPTHLPVLLATLTSGNSHQALERIEAVHHFHRDPRLRMALEQWCVAMPYRTPPGANRFWKRALEILAGVVEPGWDPEPLASRVMTSHGTSYGEKLAGWIRKIAPRPGSIRALEDDERARVEQALLAYPAPETSSAGRGSASVPQLLSEIAAHPREDAPRLVLADLLAERGDPRGELIAAQCARAQREGKLLADDPSMYHRYASDNRYHLGDDELALLKEWRGEWLGAWLSTIGWVEFERGFPVLFSLHRRASKLGKLVGDPGLATVEHVRISRDATPPSLPKFLNHPVLANLRTIDGVRPHVVSKLSPERAAQIEALTVVIGEDGDCAALAQHLGRMSGLTHLRLVGRYAAPPIAPADVEPLAVPVLEVDQDDRTGSRHHLQESLHPAVTSFVVHRDHGPTISYHGRRDQDGPGDRFERCELRVRQRWVRFDRLVSALPPEGEIDSVAAPAKTTASGEHWAQLGQLARVAPRWEEVEIHGDLDLSASPTDLPAIDCLKLGHQSNALRTLHRLGSTPEIAAVRYSYGDLVLRRGDGPGWRSIELECSTWPSEAPARGLLDALAKQVQKAAWTRTDVERAPFLEWASRHNLDVD